MREKNTSKHSIVNLIIIGISFILRLIYVFKTTVGERQHDLGYATSLHDDIVNPGHLGYVEYVTKFHHLPDFDPFSVFSYYHPPLHHIIASFFLKAADLMGIKEPQVYESIQIPTYIYSCLTILVCYAVLRLLIHEEKYITLPLCIVCFHPGLIYMTGSINNDMIAMLLTCLCIYTTMLWILRDYNAKYLYMMALSVGFGLIAKPNVGIMAFPMGIIMLMHMIDEYREKRLSSCIKQYVIFAILSIPVGLSWTIRNAIRFGTKPGIPSPSPIQYIGDYSFLSNFGIPLNNFISFPFYSEKATYNNNAWLVMFKTAIFEELWPVDITPVNLRLCQIAFILSVLLGLYCAALSFIKPVKLYKQGEKQLGIFLFVSYATLIITFILFVLKYPYVCSCNFRYIPVSLLFAAIALVPYTNKNMQSN